MKRKILLTVLLLGLGLCAFAREDDGVIFPLHPDFIREYGNGIAQDKFTQDEPVQSNEQLSITMEETAQDASAKEEPARKKSKFSLGKFFLDIEEKADRVEQGEKKFAVGAGLEWDMNSRKNFAMGAALGFDYNLPVAKFPFATGVTLTASTNFSGFSVLEPAALFRWYFLGKGHTGFFTQADVGAFLVFENGDFIPMFLGGLRGGFRMPLGSMFYAEPYGRLGYPFAFGIGALAGIRF